jgi:hypothetical protein
MFRSGKLTLSWNWSMSSITSYLIDIDNRLRSMNYWSMLNIVTNFLRRINRSATIARGLDCVNLGRDTLLMNLLHLLDRAIFHATDITCVTQQEVKCTSWKKKGPYIAFVSLPASAFPRRDFLLRLWTWTSAQLKSEPLQWSSCSPAPLPTHTLEIEFST